MFVDRYPAGFRCDYVGVSNQAGIEGAISYLRGLGHQRIAYLTTDEPTTAVLERLATYQEAMSVVNSPTKSDWKYVLVRKNIRYVLNETAVRPAFDQFFGSPELPTAIIAMNDAVAHYFMHEAQSRGKSTPADFSIIGFDDVERHSPRPATLTTLHQPFDKMGRRAAMLLLERLSHAGEDLGKAPYYPNKSTPFPPFEERKDGPDAVPKSFTRIRVTLRRTIGVSYANAASHRALPGVGSRAARS